MKLSSKIALGVFLLVCFLATLSLGFLSFAFDQTRELVISSYKGEQRSRASILAARVPFALATNDRDEIRNALNAISREYPDLKGAAIFDKSRKLVELHGPQDFSLRLTDATRLDDATSWVTSEIVYGAAPILNEEQTVGYVLVAQSLDSFLAIQRRSWWMASTTYLLSAALLIWFALLLFNRIVLNPIRECIRVASRIAQGDTDIQLQVSGTDEIAQLRQEMSRMTHPLRQFVLEAASSIETLTSSSIDLKTIANDMSGDARQTSTRSTSLAETTDKVATDAVSLSGSMERASSDLAEVTHSTAEISNGIREISRNTSTARNTIAEGVNQVTSTAALVTDLGHAAQGIGKVTETITSISAQVNLLALNATIEAARAGATGKGFAVVANEIKELAKQTADATDDIRSRIQAIQDSSSQTVSNIQGITQVINDFSQSITAIAGSVEEHSVMIRRIADHIARVSGTVTDANHRLGQTSQTIHATAQTVQDLAQAAATLTSGSGKVQTRAVELSTLAEQLRNNFRKFKV